uniref:Uncharacterized protein n=1 Tax=Anopheles coluzzii TaxID=1518534 RepID=A0A8W7PDV4_ANOCL
MQNGDGSCPNDPRMHPGSMSRMSWHDAVGHRGSVNVVLTKHTIAVLFSGTDKEGKLTQPTRQDQLSCCAAFGGKPSAQYAVKYGRQRLANGTGFRLSSRVAVALTAKVIPFRQFCLLLFSPAKMLVQRWKMLHKKRNEIETGKEPTCTIAYVRVRANIASGPLHVHV